MDTTNHKNRTIGFHPCVGKTAAGEERPTTVVIRLPEGGLAEHLLDEQQLLDFFSCGAVIAWRDRVLGDDVSSFPPHHVRRSPSTKKAYDEASEAERTALFEVKKHKTNADKDVYLRHQVPEEMIALDVASDTVGVANGGLGSQIISILLQRYPQADIRMIGSGTLKESRPVLDELLPKTLKRKAAKLRLVAEQKPGEPADGEDDAEAEEAEAEVSRSKAKDANAKFDAHRIAVALGDEAASKLFHRCTLRERDWANVSIAYGNLEKARKARVAAEQQCRQIRLAEMRSLVGDPRVPHVTLGDDADQRIDALVESYVATLRLCGLAEKKIEARTDVIRQAFVRIEGARVVEERMELHLETSLTALPEYTEFLSALKDKADAGTGLPLGKYIGERIFGRWIAGFGTPMNSRLGEVMRASDVERIAACKAELTEKIGKLDTSGLPPKPAPGGGKTREWLLACERILGEKIAAMTDAVEIELLEFQLEQVTACRDAYRRHDNARKCAKDRPLNRVIAFMGLHVRQGGKYAGMPKGMEFPRRRKGGRANWDERLLRQGAYQWGTGIIKGGDSYWKVHVYEPTKARALAEGLSKIRAHKKAFWRMLTLAVRWVINEWFAWERTRVLTSGSPSEDKAA